MEKRTPGVLSTLAGKIWAGIAVVSFLCFATLFSVFGFRAQENPGAEPNAFEAALAFSALATFVVFIAALIALLVCYLRAKSAQKHESPFRTEMIVETTADAQKGESWIDPQFDKDKLVGIASSEAKPYSYYFRFIAFSFGGVYFLWACLAIYMLVWASFALLGGDVGFPVFLLVLSTGLLLLALYGAFLHPLRVKNASKRSLANQAAVYEDKVISYQCEKKGDVYSKMRVVAHYDDVISYRYGKDALYFRTKWMKKKLAVVLPLSQMDEATRAVLEARLPKRK